VAAPAGEGFYTSDAAELRRELTGYLEQAPVSSELEGRDLLGFVSPHAGYRFSGPTAAYAHIQARNRGYKTVVVMALSHHRSTRKVALLDHDAYETPLGPVPIDRDVVRQLVAAGGDVLEVNEQAFRGEHSMEIQLPLLQLALGEGFRVVPIILATGEEAHAQRLAHVLHEQLGRRRDVLFVASSDLSHFYPDDEATEIDRGILSLITDLDIAGYRQRGPGLRNMPCGYFPILTLMELFNLYDAAARRTTLLRYQNSGDTAGDRSRVVGYGAVAFSLDRGVRSEVAPTRPVPAGSGNGSGSIPFTREDRRVLMDLARRTVAAAVRGEPAPSDRPESGLLRRDGAAFVTLSCETDDEGRCTGPGDELRGCIGHVVARVPLYQCIIDVGRSAAIHDRRFHPVEERELQVLSFEISVLTPPRPVTDPSSIVVGRDGLIMSRAMNSGLLLPQVPVEFGWDREQFLARTCHKAGMEPSCWQDPRTTIERFTAIVWGEDLEATDHHVRR
jgi:AmmeMemoRadiSam system protein B/AmmeMemoRadiSam system protein A